MAIKLVAIDIDGTLVDDHKRISLKTKEAIKKLNKKAFILSCVQDVRFLGFKII